MHRLLALALLTPALFPCDFSHLPPARPFSMEASAARGQFRRPAALLQVRLDQQPDDPDLNYQLSRALTALGDLDAALPLAEKAVAADPNSAKFHVQLAAVYGHQAEKASLFKQLGLARRARKELEAAYALDPRDFEAVYGLMRFDFAAPAVLGGDKVKAQQLADTLIALDPVRGYQAQAEVAHERKDAAAEEALLLQSIGTRPDYRRPEVYDAGMALAAYYVSINRSAAAEPIACAAVRADPARIEAWRMLAEMAALDQCWNELETLLAKAAARVPNDLSAHYAAAVAMGRSGHRRRRAEALLRQYLSQPAEANAPSLATARWQLANLLEQTGRVDEAIAELERAVSEEPSLEAARRDLRRLKKPS
ncbi:MAG TPA: hypothetical protein DEQ47_13540 [Solibacterales bacterium]|nr:hypothetical protein [Bryobacterales bacterium]